jgi:hypothetical protein
MKTKYSNLTDTELQYIMDETQEYLDKLFDEATLPWLDYVKEYDNSNIWEMYVEQRNRQVPELRDADKFELDCRESYESFKQSCKYHWFIDSDGSGYYGTETQISNIPVSCKAFYKDMERTDFEYIYWFNK